MAYTGRMVSPGLQEAVRALSTEELAELRSYIDQLDEPSDDLDLTDDELMLILRRDAELDADPSLGVPAREMIADLRTAHLRRRP